MSSKSAQQAIGLPCGLPLYIIIALLCLGTPAIAEQVPTARDRTVASLDEIANAESGFALRAWLNDGSLGDIAIGQVVEYHFLSERRAYLTVIHLDSHGVATVIHPNALASGGELQPGVATTFPQPDSGFEVKAEPPVGQEYVLAVATAKRITPAELGISLEQGPIAVVESEDAPDLAARLSKRFLSTTLSERASAHFYQRVVGRSETAEYAAVDIVDYFTTRSRSIRRPKLDLHVRFMTGSHELDVPARENLVAVAEALLDSRMQAMRFMVSGHTDDIGELDYNNALSQRRAQSVIRYLTEQQNIDPERLKASYFGETRPLESNDSPAGRRVNRRVEFQLIR